MGLRYLLFKAYRNSAIKKHRLNYLFWETTLRCNLNCLHCGSDCTKQSDVKDMPVEDFVKVCQKSWYIDGRMGFDIEILVRLHWAKVKIISEPVKVFYPENGISNYRYFQDTVRISCTYARLCLGMFVRFPVLLARKFKRK